MSARPSVLVIGKTGQVARAISRLEPASSHNYICLGRPQLDLCNPDTLKSAFKDIKPSLVINAAAYTAVDRAEKEEELAYQINAEGPASLAALCVEHDAPLIHLSTDYVFNGDATQPYESNDPTDPKSVYGTTKEAGESAIRKISKKHIILRTAWVYSEDGTNFVNTMLRLGTERDQLSIVDDQTGSPTYAEDIAIALHQIVKQILKKPNDVSWGTYHVTNRGVTTWFGFAEEIFRQVSQSGAKAPTLIPITTQDYPTPARRPKYSVLDLSAIRDEFGIELPLWQDSLKRCLNTRLKRRQTSMKDS